MRLQHFPANHKRLTLRLPADIDLCERCAALASNVQVKTPWRRSFRMPLPFLRTLEIILWWSYADVWAMDGWLGPQVRQAWFTLRINSLGLALRTHTTIIPPASGVGKAGEANHA